jgi:hypothetical protein
MIAVAAGSQGVPEELQKCHSLSRELQHNQTLLARNLSAVSQQLENFSAQVCWMCENVCWRNLCRIMT